MVVALAIRTDWPAKQPSPKKVTGSQNGHHCLLALFRDKCQLDLAYR